MAEEIINQIPGFERGKVHRVTASDEVGESFIIANMAERLRTEWNTNVLCLSLDGHKDAIESILPSIGNIARIEVMDQKNPDVYMIVNKITGVVKRRFVRSVIIGGAERLRIKSDPDGKGKDSAAIIERALASLASRAGIPIILVDLEEKLEKLGKLGK